MTSVEFWSWGMGRSLMVAVCGAERRTEGFEAPDGSWSVFDILALDGEG